VENITGAYKALLNVRLRPYEFLLVQNATFCNSRSSRWGIFFMDIINDHIPNVTVRDSRFYNNVALQGVAFFYPLFYYQSVLERNTFVGNEARLYGDTFATLAERMIWRRFPGDRVFIDSGDYLPEFSVALVDAFRTVVIPASLTVDFLFVNLTMKHTLQSKRAWMMQESNKGMLQGDDGVSFSKAQVLGNPSDYELMVAPVINYDRAKYRLNTSVTIQACLAPKIWHQFEKEPVARCIKRTSTESLTVFNLNIHFVTYNYSYLCGWV
jgi:hypothetical protein